MSVNRAAVLIGLFGGVLVMAEKTKLDPATISRWHQMKGPRAGRGQVPAKFNAVILNAGRRAGIPEEKLRECLQESCPVCLQGLRETIDLARLPSKVREFVRRG